MARKRVDLVGECFGRGKVLSFVEMRGNGKNRLSHWRLRCNCGNEYEAATGNLRGGHVRSCGCLAREIQTRNVLLYAVPACTKPPGVAAFNQLLATYKKVARNKNYKWQLTDEEFRILIYGDCCYCGISPSRMHKPRTKNGTSIVVNGVDRVDSKMGYTIDNCVSCCYQCNSSKSSYSRDDFLDWVARVYQHSLVGNVT